MNERVCCYTLDENYLFPTLLSARQVLQTTPDVDVFIFCIGGATKRSEAFRSAIERSGIGFRYIDRAAIENLPVVFARFFLHRMLDPGYERVLYLDGDTQILGDLSDLLDVPLPPGKFLAARDPMSIMTNDATGFQKLAYLESIGISTDIARLYCNSGVLRFNLADWEDIGRKVIDASADRNHTYRFPDQDPLNITCGDAYLTMSYKWNFPSFFLGLGLADLIHPRIVHFMSRPRPWDGPFEPWGRPHFEVYGELVRKFPDIAPYTRRAGVRKTARYHLQQFVKGLLEKRDWMGAGVRQQILASEGECLV